MGAGPTTPDLGPGGNGTPGCAMAPAESSSSSGPAAGLILLVALGIAALLVRRSRR
jgi:hypothetical protein